MGLFLCPKSARITEFGNKREVIPSIEKHMDDSVMEKFIEFAREKGLLLDESDIIIDDNIHRVPVEGARRINSKDGAYCIYSDGVGWVKNFRTGESKSDTQIIQRKMAERENKEHFTHNKVAGTANYLIEKQFKRANNHKYLYTKKSNLSER